MREEITIRRLRRRRHHHYRHPHRPFVHHALARSFPQIRVQLLPIDRHRLVPLLHRRRALSMGIPERPSLKLLSISRIEEIGHLQHLIRRSSISPWLLVSLLNPLQLVQWLVAFSWKAAELIHADVPFCIPTGLLPGFRVRGAQGDLYVLASYNQSDSFRVMSL